MDADVRTAIYNAAAGSGSVQAWNSVRDMYIAVRFCCLAV